MLKDNYCILIPYLAPPENLNGCLETIKDQWEHIILIDNSSDSYCKKYEGKVGKIHYHPENIGVSRSWNIGLKKGFDYTYIISVCMRFPEGFQEILDFSVSEYGLMFQHGWHLFGFTQKTIDKIGYFDTNFYPAYSEDIDYSRRINLAGLKTDKLVCKATSLGNALTLATAKVKVNFPALRQHYFEKWGGLSSGASEKFIHPYNNSTFPLSYFPEHTIKELKKVYNV